MVPLVLIYILFDFFCIIYNSLAFEWSWDALGKSAACDLSDENRTAIFHVSYSSGTAAVKGSQPMSDRQYFWEVKMTSPVYGTDMVCILKQCFSLSTKVT